MFEVKIYCDDNNTKYWDKMSTKFTSYSEALVACYEHGLDEVHTLMEHSNIDNWYEVNINFEVTEGYENELIKNVPFFPVAVICYDKAPWNRENDCCIKIVTGYDILEVPDENN